MRAGLPARAGWHCLTASEAVNGYPISIAPVTILTCDCRMVDSFLEVVYLLQYGELPNKAELEAYQEEITRHTLLREDVKHLFEAFPHSAHPMEKALLELEGVIVQNDRVQVGPQEE